MSLDEMYDDGRVSLDELLASGEYESSSKDILTGFRVFQKRYVYKSVVLQMILVLLGAASQVFNIMSAAPGEDVILSYTLILVCVILSVYIIARPRGTYKKLEKAIKELDGTVYRSDIYTNKIIISTLYNKYNDKEDISPDDGSPGDSSPEGGEKISSEEDDIPATVIHLDNSSVDIVDTHELYVVYVKKVNVFVIPKKAFKSYENVSIKDKLSNIMGIRYKC